MPDKESFVKQLYQALKDEFVVWYDKARITLGDSIYEKISEGIRKCDFGAVVFSPDFLRKNWTQEEFNGLKALQTDKRKVILPILHNLTIDELRGKWPIEAGKLATSSSEGIPAIVQAIHLAAGADRQNKNFDKDALPFVSRLVIATACVSIRSGSRPSSPRQVRRSSHTRWRTRSVA